MILRRALSVLVAGGLAAGALVLASAPAQAATYSSTLAVNGSCAASVTSGDAMPLTLQAGDQVTLVLGSQVLCSINIVGCPREAPRRIAG